MSELDDGALAKLTNPATAGLRPTAARVPWALRDHGPLTAEQIAAHRCPGDDGGRPRPTALVTFSVEVATLRHLLADDAQSGGRRSVVPGGAEGI
jgi:hypothetical protein